jgi:hypothetical protein
MKIITAHYFIFFTLCVQARCWCCSWLRHCATSWEVTGSIPDGVIGIFYWHNPSGNTVVLG